MSADRFPRKGLYVITRTEDSGDNLYRAVQRALTGGAAVVQLRDKSPDLGRSTQAARLLDLCRDAGAPLIVNDDIALARAIGADGVHLGRHDATIAEARSALGTDAIIGVSCYDSVELAVAAVSSGADYVAFGRFFPSRSKPLATPATLDTLRAARNRLSVPIVAIGGITALNGRPLIEAGADLLAVIDAVFGDTDPEQACRAFAHLFTH